MKPYYESNGVTIFLGDCREVMPTLEQVHSIICDPPYELGFMGKKWDNTGIAYDVPMWQKCLGVLRPGGHLLSFGGSRTYHRMACAIEDAGFEIRDQIMWLYGCLDEQTQLASESGVKQCHKAKVGERVLCYNPESGEYSYQPILEIVEYDYSDTAYRLIGDFGEQIVSRNHRCIVERDGSEIFQFAEALEPEICVPVLESLPELQQALSDLGPLSSRAQPVLRQRMSEFAVIETEDRKNKAASITERTDGSMRGVRYREVDTLSVVEADEESSVQQTMQRRSQRRGVENTRAQRTATLETGIGVCVKDSDDGGDESSVEGRSDLSEAQGSVCRPTDQVRPLSAGVFEHGAEGRLCDGAPSTGRSSDWKTAFESGSGASQESSCNRKSGDQPDALCDERGTQGIRAWRGHKTTVVRVVPFQYTGKMWCLRVPTGAFVAVRGGVAFPTGNSGFPKSLDVSKQLDKMAGVERSVIGKSDRGAGASPQKLENHGAGDTGIGILDGSGKTFDLTEPATEAAKQWSGYGTALKPAHEPICVARKPLEGTVAANVQKHGTGALNIDGCRVNPGELIGGGGNGRASIPNGFGSGLTKDEGTRPRVDPHTEGRWPANIITDGSEEVVSLFPQTSSAAVTNEIGGYDGESVTGFIRGRSDSSNQRADSGSAARFFYTAKASQDERGTGNNHPTVKPLDLMAYLCKLLCPPSGGILLDPFMGSGSTIIAGRRFYQHCIGIELEEKYCEIAAKRLSQEVLDFGGTE
jgi:site-specific DNA-methyltransferase (adenine-specific)